MLVDKPPGNSVDVVLLYAMLKTVRQKVSAERVRRNDGCALGTGPTTQNHGGAGLNVRLHRLRRLKPNDNLRAVFHLEPERYCAAAAAARIRSQPVGRRRGARLGLVLNPSRAKATIILCRWGARRKVILKVCRMAPRHVAVGSPQAWRRGTRRRRLRGSSAVGRGCVAATRKPLNPTSPRRRAWRVIQR